VKFTITARSLNVKNVNVQKPPPIILPPKKYMSLTITEAVQMYQSIGLFVFHRLLILHLVKSAPAVVVIIDICKQNRKTKGQTFSASRQKI